MNCERPRVRIAARAPFSFLVLKSPLLRGGVFFMVGWDFFLFWGRYVGMGG